MYCRSHTLQRLRFSKRIVKHVERALFRGHLALLVPSQSPWMLLTLQ
jgi:hypothetical protein